MTRPKLTDSQRCMLRCIDDFAAPDDGWAEVELQFSCIRGLPQNLEAATCERVILALKRKGLIGDDGPELTDAGQAEMVFGRTEWQPDGRIRMEAA